MKKLSSFKRLITLLMSFITVFIEWRWYSYYFYNELYPRWIAENLPIWIRGRALMVVLYAFILLVFVSMYGGMKLNYYKSIDIIFSIIFATLFTNIITYVQCSLMCMKLLPGYMFITMTLLQIGCSAFWIVIAQWIMGKIFPPRKLLLISAERPIEDIVSKFNTRKDKYDIVKCINVPLGVDALKEEILKKEEYDGIVIWDVPASMRNNLVKFCYANQIRIYTMPKISDVILKGSEQLHLFDTPVLLTREYALTMEQRFVKRLIDLICAIILFVITSPIMLITAILVKCYDGGPILYKQVRCTRDMKEFKILKFRSMRIDAEKDGVARLASKGDARITPIGRFIRKVRIDELPQLINIIKGEMSFIGPRPERPEIIEQYTEEMPEFVYRTRVKAGLAGYAQVYGKYNTTPYDKLKLDLFYIENYTVWMDLKLMFLTLKILFTPDSTEGIDESQVTAQKNNNEVK